MTTSPGRGVVVVVVGKLNTLNTVVAVVVAGVTFAPLCVVVSIGAGLLTGLTSS